MKRPTDEEYVEMAELMYCAGSDDDIEIDPGAEVSQNDIGAWVQAWVFVRDEECGEQYDRDRNTTTCAKCGHDYPDEEMLPLKDCGEVCEDCAKGASR